MNTLARDIDTEDRLMARRCLVSVEDRTYELQGMNALLEAEITRHEAAALQTAPIALLE